jgi:hypothetical protein
MTMCITTLLDFILYLSVLILIRYEPKKEMIYKISLPYAWIVVVRGSSHNLNNFIQNLDIDYYCMQTVVQWK